MNREAYEVERQRRQIRRRLFELIDELEGRPVRRHRGHGFPFDQLEGGINWLLTGLEVVVDYIVDRILKDLDERGLRRRRRRNA
jgi:hypothetical protein